MTPVRKRKINYTICRPLKGMTKNYWIGLETGVARILIVAHIQPTKSSKKYKKELEAILDNSIGSFELELKP